MSGMATSPAKSPSSITTRRGNRTNVLRMTSPALPEFDAYDLGLSHDTYFQTFNVFSPWLGLPASGALPDFASVAATNELSPLTFSDLLREAIERAQGASISGPQGYGIDQYVPAHAPLPYTISFENAADSSTWTNADPRVDAARRGP